MRPTAVAATEAELAPTPGRVEWDRELYRSLIRWGDGVVVPIEGRRLLRTTVGRACRLLSTTGTRVSSRWKASSANRILRDVAQVEAVVPPGGTEVLYGNITFPSSPGLPTVWSTQGIPHAPGGLFVPSQSARTQARLARRAAAVQCWSRSGLEGLQRWAPSIPEERVHLVPPLVYIDLPDPWARDSSDLVALFVGAQARLKGLDVVIEAMRRIGPGLRLEVVTAEPPPGSLPPSVDWLGPRPNSEVLARLRTADVHLFVSRAESFGVAAVEALAVGIPQVVAAGCVPAEIAGPSGVPADGTDPASVASALEAVAGDDSLRRVLRAKAVERYRAEYSPEAVGPRLEAILDSV